MSGLNVSANQLFIESISSFNESLAKSVANNDISKSVKRLLSSLQSTSKRYPTIEKYPDLSTNSIFSQQMIKCLTKLEKIVLFEESYAETSVLSGLAFAFALNIYLVNTEKAIHLYFKLLSKRSIVSINLIDYQIDNDLCEDLRNSQTTNDLTKVSLLSGLLNCNYFIDYLIEFHSKVFVQIHCHIIRILEEKSVHQFHEFRLLQHWFRTFNNYSKQLSLKEPNLLDDKNIINDTLIQIDNNWEHPINGVKDCIKIIYNLLLESFKTFKNLVSNNCDENYAINSYDLITEEVVKTSRLALTSKAKYRKMSALTSFIGWKSVLETDANLWSQMFKYLSINSLSTAIIELYKAIIISMKSDTKADILNVWSKYFLESMCSALKSKNKVIHNNLTAHLLPFTLKNIENSTQLIFENLEESRLAEVVVIRIAVDNNLYLEFSQSFSWFKSILMNNEEMVREEALNLIVEERYIKDRDKVFQLFQFFLMSNLNIDNPSFRQQIISKIDKFIAKICISLCDKFALHQSYDELDQKSVQFLKDFSDIIVNNMISGASYQRRTTCLLLFDSLLSVTSKYQLNMDHYLNCNQTFLLVFISIIDKDDKIRKLATNLLIKFNKSYENSIDYNFDIIAMIALKFVNSPRHQECHSGALIYKFIINCFKNLTVDHNIISNELELIEYFLRSAQNQFELSKENLLISAKSNPIHGFLLALNNCLSFDIINLWQKNRIQEVVNHSIELCFDCSELMLKQLSKSNIDSSPSFQEMCESLETLINKQNDGKEEIFDDISSSNDFQLLLSLCWLNIKECSFLLSNLVDLCLKFEHKFITDSTVHKIGSQLINILSKCRHKGVIEATCIALTSYTVSLIKAKSRNSEYMKTLSQLLSDSLSCITKSALTSSITRKSAGLALTIQAILTGEAEAFSEGFKVDKSLFSQTIDQLIETANSTLPKNIDIKNDLPQTYALHILKSIISTASLSRFSLKIVEFLLPICINGFSSDIWQIRNASLQLYGSCCCRMLGQRKISDLDHMMTEGSTITSNELFSRYPTLFETFKTQFEKSSEKIENGFFSTELVPVLSLLASFSPICLGEPYSDRQILSHLIRLLSNKIWKIRMLSAKALSCLLPINHFQNVLFDLSSQQNLDCNSIHGLMLSVNHLLELKQQNKDNDYYQMKDYFSGILQKFINDNQKCFVLNDIFQQIFSNTSLPIYCCEEMDSIQESIEINKTEFTLNEFLNEIHSKVEFTKTDDIRLFAANSLNSKLEQIIGKLNSSEEIFKLVDILLIILEDEDRTIRTEAEQIASKLIDSNKMNSVMNFNVAVDHLLLWLTNNPLITAQELTDYLYNKLESNISLSQLIDSQLQNYEVLFEREEKNVFAEPFFKMFKFGHSLQYVITKHSTKICDKSLNKLAIDCIHFLEHLSVLQMQNLVTFSIWKLPKLFICFNSLYLRIEMFYNSLIYVNSDETNISSITKSLDELNICQDHFQTKFNLKLSEEEWNAIIRSHRLLSSKFTFLSTLKQNSLLKFGF